MENQIKNLEKVAKRILKAIKNKEKIILYGDADLDGISSVIILKDTIKSLNGEIAAIYFPNREEEWYGLNEKALNFLQKETPALLITLDCGIGNFNEVKKAKEIGFEVIIVDHHEILDKLPQASIIVDPKQKGDDYPFKEFATAGIVFELSKIILKGKLSGTLEKNFLELTALATLADMMPQEEDNKFFIEEGLRSLDTTFRPGLKVFFEIDSLNNISVHQVIQKIISALNTSSVVGHLNQSFLLLTTSSSEEAKNLATDLLEKAYQKQFKIKEITERIEARIQEKTETSIIFEGDSSLPVISTGTVTSRICNTYRKPTFIFKIGKKESQGAVRMPSDINGVKALINCKEFLKTYGGHPRAAGFRLDNENLEKFKGCLIDYFNKHKDS